MAAVRNIHTQRPERPGVHRGPLPLRGRRGVMCTINGVGYTPWRPSGSGFLRNRYGMMYVTKGSDVRPGILRPPRFFVYRCGKMCIFYSVTFTYSLSLLHPHTLAHSRAQNRSHSLILTYTLTHTHSLILAYTHRHTHSAPCSLRGRRGIMYPVKGRIFPPGVPRAPPFFAW